jgi:hypothetical protein
MSIAEFWSKYWNRLRCSWSGKPPEEHEQQLMQLYWNRAELKKELSTQQTQRHALAEQLRTQEAATRRALEQQEQLHAYLGNPEYGANALVYFQLRALWKLSSELLAKFSAELRRQQEDRERLRHREECEARRAARLSVVNDQLLNAQSLAASLQARVQLLTSRRAELGRWWLPGLWNYSRRRELAKEIAHLQVQVHAAVAQARDFREERAHVANTPLAEFPGISLEGKRLVNTAIIAYTEFLIARLPHRGLAPLAKDATSVQVYDIQFGAREDCARLMSLAKTALQSLSTAVQDLTTLKDFTDRLRARIAYRGDTDSVPIAESIQDTTAGRPQQSAATDQLEHKHKGGALNVLVDDYWGVSGMLLR